MDIKQLTRKELANMDESKKQFHAHNYARLTTEKSRNDYISRIGVNYWTMRRWCQKYNGGVTLVRRFLTDDQKRKITLEYMKADKGTKKDVAKKYGINAPQVYLWKSTLDIKVTPASNDETLEDAIERLASLLAKSVKDKIKAAEAGIREEALQGVMSDLDFHTKKYLLNS